MTAKNIFPQNSSINSGKFKGYECWVKKQVEAGCRVCVKVELNYIGIGFGSNTSHPGRPASVKYNVWVGGKHHSLPFPNRMKPEPPSPKCKRT